ncbi:unnamed protein product [Oppiella nova]|uniref:Alpha-1,6-mannosyl-glycoprotein 2-beta-N-acetylglucosaminyltransferase n=1 Tax=Oppiella nova TaxID=334625 RepID=A0A7R9LDK6_9ACAR|nr:unnamed protein product [Oppiella nova]CAG2162569.1 unnamed protein product [Oppiella nova]
MVTSIKFCKTMQIFYPKSLQLNPNSFPGDSVDDCPRDLSIKEAQRIGCRNRLNADSYGHFREAKYTQTKHHFWWKINAVMSALEMTRSHSGDFMFIEEDHYLSPDALHVWKLIKQFRNDNEIITLGSYTRSVDFVQNGHLIERSQWISSRHNMAFIINRNIWHQIKDCAQSFCTYDDYNWDWSLQYVSENCLKSPLYTLVVSTPRVYHTGECGLHHKTKRCNNKEIIQTIRDTFESSKNYLFPKRMALHKRPQKAFRMPKPNGGWADPRDHELCLNQTNHSFG